MITHTRSLSVIDFWHEDIFGISLGHIYNRTSDPLISLRNHSCIICCCLFPFSYHDTLWFVVLRCMDGIFSYVLNTVSNLSLLHDIASNLCLLHDNASKPPFWHDMLWASNMHWLYIVFALLIDMSTWHAMWLIYVVKWYWYALCFYLVKELPIVALKPHLTLLQ